MAKKALMLQDIADSTGVPRSVVLRVVCRDDSVNPAMQARVLKAIKSADYKPKTLEQISDVADVPRPIVSLVVCGENGVEPTVREHVLDVIKKVGYQPKTLEQVADIAKVSRSTVSRVVRDHQSVSPTVRERVLGVIEATGYQPNAAARSLAGRRTNVLGLVIAEPAQSLFTDPYYPMVIQGVTQATNDYDQTLTLFLFHTNEDEEKLSLRLIRNQLVDGLIITGTHVDDPLVPRLIKESNIPFVLIGRHEHHDVSYIDTDNVSGAQSAVTYLLRLGHERVGMITGTMKSRGAIDRYEGYKQALQARNISLDEALVIEGDFSEYSGYAAMKKLIVQKIDAVFVSSDGMALGALRAAREAGLSVPQDIAVVSFDDIPAASHATPPLTTVRQAVRQTGKMAVETLLDILESGKMPPRRLALPTELIVRESCGGTQSK